MVKKKDVIMKTEKPYFVKKIDKDKKEMEKFGNRVLKNLQELNEGQRKQSEKVFKKDKKQDDFRLAKKELVDINKKIEILELKKKNLMREKGIVFCPRCEKFYPGDKCRQGPIMSDGFLEEWEVTCPKGHKWDDK